MFDHFDERVAGPSVLECALAGILVSREGRDLQQIPAVDGSFYSPFFA